MTLRISDPSLPGLERLDAADLERIAGSKNVRVLRLRYQPGARAILHVAYGEDAGQREGSVWFFAGDKARNLASKTKGARYDEVTKAMFQAFPDDHRLPAVAAFADRWSVVAPELIGCTAAAAPELLRYRPGVSATFRCTGADGRVAFVKIEPNLDVAARRAQVSQLADALGHTGVRVPDVLGTSAALGAIAYGRADGISFDALASEGSVHHCATAGGRLVRALATLSATSVVPDRKLDRATLLDRARKSVTAISVADSKAGEMAKHLFVRLSAEEVACRMLPIHADMKPEHAFISNEKVTLIDVESLRSGDPDYDVASLEARLLLSVVTDAVPRTNFNALRTVLRGFGGGNYGWFLGLALLQCSRHLAQRPGCQHMEQWRAILSEEIGLVTTT